MKKVIQIILICLMLAGIIVIATLGFNVGIKYGENTQISIYIGKEYNIEDIKSIAKEVFGNQTMLVQEIEIYKDIVQITVKEASNEQIEQLNNKVNEKYGLENDISNEEDIMVVRKSNTKLRHLVKPYIMPIAISFAIILAYEVIRFRKLGIWKILYEAAITIIAPQAILFSIYAVARIPVNRLTAVISITLYIISIFVGIDLLLKKKEKSLSKEK